MNSKKIGNSFSRENYADYAERMRARWDLSTYWEVLLKQKIEKGKHPIAEFFYKIVKKFNSLSDN